MMILCRCFIEKVTAASAEIKSALTLFITFLRNERYVGIYYWNKYQYTVMRKRITRKENPEIVRIEKRNPRLLIRRLGLWYRNN